MDWLTFFKIAIVYTSANLARREGQGCVDRVTERIDFYMVLEHVGRSRPIQKKFFLTEEENQSIMRNMTSVGLKNFSNFARLMLLKGEVKVVNFEEISNLRKEINAIGVNINQIAKVANRDERVATEQVAMILNQLKQVEKLLEQVTNQQISQIGEEDGLFKSLPD